MPDAKRIRAGKCRRKESGYAVEGDIKFIPTRPREVYLSTTYSAIELVQGLAKVTRQEVTVPEPTFILKVLSSP